MKGLKKYLLFLFDSYGVGGGWTDFVDDFDTVKEAQNKAKQETIFDDYQIVDTEKREIIEEGFISKINGALKPLTSGCRPTTNPARG